MQVALPKLPLPHLSAPLFPCLEPLPPAPPPATRDWTLVLCTPSSSGKPSLVTHYGTSLPHLLSGILVTCLQVYSLSPPHIVNRMGAGAWSSHRCVCAA